ncbi:MAG: hypothetical protein HY675_23070 [Chloroflexi bacterium]|nr:hypothetical protein [Chloroflexota bacterium]
MNCFHCDKPASGVCRFCGRALCKEHMKNRIPYIITIFVGDKQIPKAVAVADALFCGTCKPQPEPIEMPELY